MNYSKEVERVAAGEAEWAWAEKPLVFRGEIDGEPQELKVWTMPDAMKLDGLRFKVTAIEAQQIADLIGAMLPTAKIEDATYQQCNVLIRAVTMIGRQFTAVSSVEAYNEAVDKQLASLARAGVVVDGVIATVGKSWVLHPKLRPGVAVNYGWHDPAAPYRAATAPMALWQQEGSRHNDMHEDPSQVCRLPRRAAELNGGPVDLADLIMDRKLAPLICHHGALASWRQPGVEHVVGVFVAPPATITG